MCGSVRGGMGGGSSQILVMLGVSEDDGENKSVWLVAVCVSDCICYAVVHAFVVLSVSCL